MEILLWHAHVTEITTSSKQALHLPWLPGESQLYCAGVTAADIKANEKYEADLHLVIQLFARLDKRKCKVSVYFAITID
jgi:hypothetical protein